MDKSNRNAKQKNQQGVASETIFDDVSADKALNEVPTADETKRNKQSLLANLLEQRVATASAFPLSYAQQRLWFLDQFEPGSSLYNISMAIRLQGQLDSTALERSLDEVVRRHEALRTTFVAHEGRPAQVIASELRLALRIVEVTAEQVEQVADEEAQHAFNLEQGPLIYATLLRVQPQTGRHDKKEHVLLLVLHHIVSDGWSLSVIFEEVAQLYDAYVRGMPSPLPELPIQYVDYAVWQQSPEQRATLDRQLDYWKESLASAPAVLELPTDRPRPSVQTFIGTRQFFKLTKELTRDIQNTSRHEGVTPFMTLLAAFGALLARYSGQEDVVIGTPIAGRTRTETERLIGLFINTLALRLDLSGDPSFVELVRRVRQAAFGAYTHQEVPFEQVVEAVQPERTLNHSPLFQVMFVLHNTPTIIPALTGIQTEQVDVERGVAKFDITLALVEENGVLEGALEYNTDLFDHATATRMIEHYRTLLEGIVAHPEQQLSTLPLLTPTERQQLLVEWNKTEASYPNEQCLHHLFEAQVQRTPDAIAVAFSDGDYKATTLTYCQLDQRANQLAHYLRQREVGPDVRVGLCVERSLDMIVGLLGILKAGGAYVPLDPNYPAERVYFMLANADIPVLLTQEALRNHLTTPSEVQTICLDADWPQIALQNIAAPASMVSAENLAYVIYTSGSTGVPKGVQIPHRALVNFLCSMANQLAITSGDVLLAVTSLSFDIAGLELYLPLLQGAQVAITSREVTSDGDRLAAQLASSKATMMQATPVTWRLLLQSGWVGEPGFTILCGGEALPRDLATQLRATGSACWNLYGPTETTIWSTLAALATQDDTVSIGWPIANTQLYLLDSHLQPVPVGVPGELYIAGDGLARGYLNRPDLTAERFIPAPFSTVPGVRMYHTGDLARYRADGSVEYLGRNDQQIKLRGYRIELGEIEARLSQHEAVRTAVAVVREDTPGNPHLVAYLIPATEQAPAAAELRSYVQTSLPEYMVPSAFVFLEALPLTPNGKVDRKALPAPDQTASTSDRPYEVPQTPIEEQIASIWQEVLGVTQVGRQDNFFQLGGHSLLATQVVARIQTAFNVSVPVRTLFEAAMLADLAQIVEVRQQDSEHMEPVASIQRVARSQNDQVLDRLGQLSEDDLEALLATLLERKAADGNGR